MADFSAVIIANNEEKHIAACISSLKKITKDVILVDSGSTDKTKEIAKSAGARVYEYSFKGYGANKNFGNAQAINDWIISLDGDEILSPELTHSILNLEPQAKCVYALNSLVNYGGQWIKHSGWYPRYKNRIFNKKECKWNEAKVHEDLTSLEDKQIIRLQGDVWHYSYHSFEDHYRKSKLYGKLKGDEWIRKKRSPSFLKQMFSPIFAFFKSYILQLGILDGKAGFNIAKMNYLQYKWAVEHYKAVIKQKVKS